MRHHVKASSAGSIQAKSTGLGILASLSALLLLLVMALGAAATQADLYSLGHLGSFANPAGVAVKQSSGNIYVADQGSNNVQVFDNAGSFILSFGKGVNATTAGDVCTAASGDTCQAGNAGSANGAFDNPLGIAVDQGSGDVYVVDSGNRRVEKFDASGNYLAKFGSPGTGNGEFSAWPDGSFIAVGPGGNVFVGDGASNPRIEKFDSSGAFLEALSGANVLGGVYGLALDSTGKIYDLDRSADGSSAAVHKLDATGAPEYDLAGLTAPRSLAVDPATGDVYALDSAAGQITQFDSAGSQTGNPFGTGTIAGSRGLAYDSGDAVLYVADSGCGCVRSFGTPAVGAPQIESSSSSGASVNSATLEAQINPEGAETTYYFEWGADTSYGNAQPLPPGISVGESFSSQPVSEEIAGLQPSTTYHYHVVAINSEGTVEGPDGTFATTTPPEVELTSALTVWTDRAVLQAKINPEGTPTNYHFEFGTTSAYGTNVPVPDANIGSGTAMVHVSQTIAPLLPETTYHYRVVAHSLAGTTEGPDRILTTPGKETDFKLPDNRAYELVSPVEKGGNDIGVNPWRTRAAADGNAVSYISHGAFADAGGSSTGVDYISTRGPSGWTTHGLTPSSPATFPLAGLRNQTRYTGEFSADLSKGIIYARTPLTDSPNVAVANNLYLRDNLRAEVSPNPGSGAHYQLLTESVNHLTTDESGFLTEVGPLGLSDVNPSFTSVAFESVNNLTADATGEYPKAYVWDNGTVRLAGILPGGAAAPGSVPGVGEGTGRLGVAPMVPGLARLNRNVISNDGSRMVFEAGPFDSLEIPGGNLYMRENGSVTIKLNQSERTTPDPSGPYPATYVGASTDDSRVFFLSRESLVDQDVHGKDLYMYRTDAPAGEHLSLVSMNGSAGGGVKGLMGNSDDGKYAYFLSDGHLVPGQPAPHDEVVPNADAYSVYAWHEGEIKYVGVAQDYGSGVNLALPTEGGGEFAGIDSRVTPDGKTLIYADRAANPPYQRSDTCPGNFAGSDLCTEVYAYSYDTGELVCASCDSRGMAPFHGVGTSDSHSLQVPANAEFTGGPDNMHLTNVLSEDGRYVFFSSNDSLVPEDTNGRRDVYEYDLRDKAVHLLSTGQCGCDSTFAEASPDGSTVFIQTRQQLVGIDRDRNADLYAVRVNGGIPAQNAPEASGCEGDACQAPAVAPNDPTPSSAAFSGPGSQAQKLKKKRHRKRRQQRKHHARVHVKHRHV